MLSDTSERNISVVSCLKIGVLFPAFFIDLEDKTQKRKFNSLKHPLSCLLS